MSAELPKMVACTDCGMPCDPREYHPFAACLMFKACHSSDAVRANLEAVRQEAARQAMERCADIAFQKAARVNSSWIATDIARDIRALIPQDPDHLAGVGNMVDGKDQSEERHG